MTKTAKYIIGPIFLGVFCMGVLGCSNPVAEQNHIPGQLLVLLAEPLSQPEVVKLTDTYEIALLEHFEYVHIILVGVPDGQEVVWIEKLEKDNFIKSASLVRNNVTLR